MHDISTGAHKATGVVLQLQKQMVHTLIDTGSTHNLISKENATFLGFPITQIDPVTITVANGDVLVSTEASIDITWYIHGEPFTLSTLILPLTHYDVILGLDWLRSLGVITWDFTTMTMSFLKNGQHITLQGGTKVFVKWVVEEKMRKLLAHPTKVACSQVCYMADLWTMQETTPFSPPIQDLLTSFKDIFAEPTALPPPRPFDHQIPLHPGSKPITLCPYKLSKLQKDEVEKQIANLLSTGFIENNNSPYAAPILLIKKKDGGWRLCVDYRALNLQTVKTNFPYLLLKNSWMNWVAPPFCLNWTCVQAIIRYSSTLHMPLKQHSKPTKATTNFVSCHLAYVMLLPPSKHS